MEYSKIALNVMAQFRTDGTVIPYSLTFGNRKYTIDRILACRHHNPGTVGCIAPIEYTVVVEGQTKKIYFEPDSFLWFSVKEQR